MTTIIVPKHGLIMPRRNFLTGLSALFVAPAIIPYGNLMPVKVLEKPEKRYWIIEPKYPKYIGMVPPQKLGVVREMGKADPRWDSSRWYQWRGFTMKELAQMHPPSAALWTEKYAARWARAYGVDPPQLPPLIPHTF